MLLNRSTLIAAFGGLITSTWIVVCLTTSAYLTFPHKELYFAVKGVSFFEWVTIVVSMISGDINLFVLLMLVFAASTFGAVFISYLAFKFSKGLSSIAYESYGWAIKSLFNNRVLLIVFTVVSIAALLLANFESLFGSLNLAAMALTIFLPFFLLQERLISSKNYPNIITCPDWPGWSVILSFFVLEFTSIAVDLSGDILTRFDLVHSYIIYGVEYLFTFLIISLLQTWILTTKSGFKSISKNWACLFSKEMLSGWLILAMINVFLIVLVLAPVACVSVLDVFFYPAIMDWSITSGVQMEYSWQFLHSIYNNGSNAGAFLVLPFEAVFWLSAGRYVWLLAIETKAECVYIE